MPNTREKLIELLSVGNDCPDGRNPFVEESCSTCPYEKAKNCGAEIQADNILASDFITELQNEAYDLGVDSALHNHFGLSWEDAAGLRKEIKRLQDAARWIPVTERLPEKAGKYLVTTKSCFKKGETYTQLMWYGAKSGFHISDPDFGCMKMNKYVTHWMPLPDAPKGD